MATIAGRVHSAAEADASTGASISGVLDDIRDNIRDAENKISRRIVIVAILFGLFELTRRSGIVQVAAFGISLTDVNVVLLWIPVIISYLYLAMACGVSKIKILEEAYDGIFSSIYPNLKEADCIDYILPLNRARLYSLIKMKQAGLSRIISGMTIHSIFFTTVFVPPAIVIYMFFVQISRSGADLVTAVAIILAVICILPVPLLLVGTLKVIGSKSLVAMPLRRAD